MDGFVTLIFKNFANHLSEIGYLKYVNFFIILHLTSIVSNFYNLVHELFYQSDVDLFDAIDRWFQNTYFQKLCESFNLRRLFEAHKLN